MSLDPTGLVHGHYECRSLDQTLPIFVDLLAAQVVERGEQTAVVKHPNTGWLLVVHEGDPDAPDKPHNNHYGFRVEGFEEVNAAYDYIMGRRRDYGIRILSRPHEAHYAYSVYFREPGGNDLEIEWYDQRAVQDGRSIAAPHWKERLPQEAFPDKGYLPQAMSHGTLQCDDPEASNRFYEHVLGLEIAGGGKVSTYIRHANTPWYIVVLPGRKRKYLSRTNRFTLQLASPEAVEQAHETFATSGKTLGVTELDDIEIDGDDARFTFCDLDKNWWEASSTARVIL